MGRPFRTLRELEGHLERGELESAAALARGLARERGRPLELELTLRFLPLIAAERPERYDSWALRWLEHWCAELREVATIDEAAAVAAALGRIAEHGGAALREAQELTEAARSGLDRL
ncbi:MAG TPA: hypothetical protein VMA83_06920 [Solirubrobacteraceae bacterium]|nr:hypothetical protein [Solirubrobacteraceae bacterium]